MESLEYRCRKCGKTFTLPAKESALLELMTVIGERHDKSDRSRHEEVADHIGSPSLFRVHECADEQGWGVADLIGARTAS